MKKIIRFVIIAAMGSLYLFTVPQASAESPPASSWLLACANQCKGKRAAALRDCLNRFAPPNSKRSGDGGGVFGGGGVKLSSACDICKSNCNFETNQFKCCEGCYLVCPGEYWVTNCPSK